VAKELGIYKGKSSKAWDDELLVGDTLSSQDNVMESLLKDAAARVSEDAEVIPEADVVPVERPVPRESEADKKGDVKRLDRAMDRTLYLVVKGKEGWVFPADQLLTEGETLHVVCCISLLPEI
jgi:large subunit ribosomal protein L46